MCQVVSFGHISLNPVLGFPLGVVQGVVLWLAPVQTGMELNFVVQVQVVQVQVVQVQVWVLVQHLVHWAEMLVCCWVHLQHLHCWQEAGGLCPSPHCPPHHLQ